MLVLMRRESEKIYIGDDIEIVIVRVEGGKVRVGIQAPKDIQIRRDDAIKGEKRE